MLRAFCSVRDSARVENTIGRRSIHNFFIVQICVPFVLSRHTCARPMQYSNTAIADVQTVHLLFNFRSHFCHTPRREKERTNPRTSGVGATLLGLWRVLHVFWETPPRWYTLNSSNKHPSAPRRNRSGRKSSTWSPPQLEECCSLNCGSRRKSPC